MIKKMISPSSLRKLCVLCDFAVKRVGFEQNLVKKINLSPVSILVMNVCFLWAGAGTEAKELSVSQSEGNMIEAETKLLKHRLSYPGDHFLLDGYASVIVDSLFYMNTSYDEQGLWPRHFLNGSYLEPSNVEKGGKFIISGTAGNEIGDPHLQEMSGVGVDKNRTPFFKGSAALAISEALEIWGAIHQNDHFSYTTVHSRLQTLEEPKSAWFGENIPTASMAGAGFRYRQGLFTLSSDMHSGWLWLASPYSGFQYPWRVNQYNGSLDIGEHLTFTGFYQKWNSLSTYHNKGNLRQGETSLTLKGSNVEAGNKAKSSWEFAPGIRLLSLFLKADSAVNTLPLQPEIHVPRAYTFPLRLYFSHNRQLKDSLFLITGDTRIRYEQQYYSLKGQICLTENISGVFFYQKIKGYYQNQLSSYPYVNEEWISSGTRQRLFGTQYNPDFDNRGIGLLTGIQKKMGSVHIDVNTSATWEWEINQFVPDSIFMLNGLNMRTGSVRYYHHPVFGTRQTLTASQTIPVRSAQVNWQFRSSYRHFFENQKELLDYLPAPYHINMLLGCYLTTNLQIHASTAVIGSKEVRRWQIENKTFTIPAHWEHNISLVQSFFNSRLQCRLSALHFLGEEILEHPNGNPLRFRIITGIRYYQ
ncbi:MAG: hypothetical protein HQK83_14255 [Fibrobacteria bacterium]|nr:hypothetical protein [Fibrobacteria bacterium]